MDLVMNSVHPCAFDARMLEQHALDLLRIDVGAVVNDDLLPAAAEVEIPVLIGAHDVARIEPAVDERPRRRLLVFPVADAGGIGLDPHLPSLPIATTAPSSLRIEIETPGPTLAPELWWDLGQPLYEVGKYAEAAAKGMELIEARPDQPYLYYNVACYESLAGRTAEAIDHLRTAIEMWEDCRGMARDDPDFGSIRDLPAFRELLRR
jgi:hypothetical protein